MGLLGISGGDGGGRTLVCCLQGSRSPVELRPLERRWVRHEEGVRGKRLSVSSPAACPDPCWVWSGGAGPPLVTGSAISRGALGRRAADVQRAAGGVAGVGVAGGCWTWFCCSACVGVCPSGYHLRDGLTTPALPCSPGGWLVGRYALSLCFLRLSLTFSRSEPAALIVMLKLPVSVPSSAWGFSRISCSLLSSDLDSIAGSSLTCPGDWLARVTRPPGCRPAASGY